jgi:F-type H+-transporting ATPase subunit epsilon
LADGDNTFTAEVLTPEGEVYSGEVVQISTRTVTGEIGILARHAPILAALEPTELRIYRSESDVDRYAQAHGYMQVFANHAQILVEEAIPPDDLDQSDLKEQLNDAEQRLKDAEEDSAAATRAQKDRERAQAFIEIAGGS